MGAVEYVVVVRDGVYSHIRIGSGRPYARRTIARDLGYDDAIDAFDSEQAAADRAAALNEQAEP